MQETAGNDYQGTTLTFNINLLAQQDTAPEARSGTLLMDNKDAGWDVIKGDKVWGVLKFNTTGTPFNYSFTGSGLDPSLQYRLVYWIDPSGPQTNMSGLVTPNADGTLTFSGTATPAVTSLKNAKIWLRPVGDSSLKTLWEYNLIDFN